MKTRKDIGLAVAIMIAVVLIVAGLMPVITSGIMVRKYQEFVNHYTASMSVSRKIGRVTAIADSVEQTLDVDRAGQVYDLILLVGMGKPQSRIPDGDPVEIRFSDSAVIRFWEVEITEKAAKNDRGVFISYQTEDGYQYQYDTDELRLETILGKLKL